jgi:hypothetical protein
MAEIPQRRATDIPGVPERLAVLEMSLRDNKTALMDIRTDLKAHILDEGSMIQGTRDDITIIRAQGEHVVAMVKDSHQVVLAALDKLIDQGTKVHVLEIKQLDTDEHKKHTEARFDRMEQDHAVTKEQVKRILLGFGFLGSTTLVAIGWLLQHFRII